MIMAYAFDFALLFIATCSALYCWTLSRRLHALQNLRKGVGQAMVNLTKSVTAVEANAAKLNREALAAVSELRIMLAKVDASEEKVDNLLQTMERQARETWREYREKTGEATESLDTAYRALAEAVAEAHELSQSIEGQSAEKLARVAPAPPVRKKRQPVQPRAEITGDRDMTAREVALARALAARRAEERVRKPAPQKSGPEDDLAAYTAAPLTDAPTDDAVASFARRLRQKQGRGALKQNPFAGRSSRQAKG
ncbi:MAG: hypothetical protein AAGA69_01200 [Pseudomonadota bacterium]